MEGAVVRHLRWVSGNPPAGHDSRRAPPPGLDERADTTNAAFFRDVTRWWRVHEHYGTVRRFDFDVLYALWLGPAQEYSRQWLAGATTTDPTAIAPELARAAWDSLRNQE